MKDEETRGLPSLAAIRAFEALGRTGSVRAAGDDLGVSHTVVSRHLRNLQAALGVVLVQPEGRGLVLTPEGRIFHAEVSKAFALLRRATAAARMSKKPRLVVWCTPGIVNRRLLARLPELAADLPSWDIIIQPTLAFPDLARGEADAAIVYSDRIDAGPALWFEPLVRPRVFPVASPDFLRRNPPIRSLAELASGVLLHEETTGQWETWLRLAGLETTRQLRGQRLWHAHVAIEAARLSQGIAIGNELLVDAELAAGTLVEVLNSDIRIASYHLVVLEERRSHPALLRLREWLGQALALPETGA